MTDLTCPGTSNYQDETLHFLPLSNSITLSDTHTHTHADSPKEDICINYIDKTLLFLQVVGTHPIEGVGERHSACRLLHLESPEMIHVFQLRTC